MYIAKRAYPGDPVLKALWIISKNFLAGANRVARGITGLMAVLRNISDAGGKRFDICRCLQPWRPVVDVECSVAADTATF